MSGTAVESGLKIYFGESLDKVLPQIRAELGPNALILRQREGIVGGIGGFFGRKCVEVEAVAGPEGSTPLQSLPRRAIIDAYDTEVYDPPALDADEERSALGQHQPRQHEAFVAHDPLEELDYDPDELDEPTPEQLAAHEVAVSQLLAEVEQPAPVANHLVDALLAQTSPFAATLSSALASPPSEGPFAVPAEETAPQALVEAPVAARAPLAGAEPTLTECADAIVQEPSAAPSPRDPAVGAPADVEPPLVEPPLVEPPAVEPSAAEHPIVEHAAIKHPVIERAGGERPQVEVLPPWPFEDGELSLGSLGWSLDRLSASLPVIPAGLSAGPDELAKLREELVAAAVPARMAGEIIAEARDALAPFEPDTPLRRLVRRALTRRIPVARTRRTVPRRIVVIGPAGAGRTLATASLVSAYAQSDRSVVAMSLEPARKAMHLGELLGELDVGFEIAHAPDLVSRARAVYADADIVVADAPPLLDAVDPSRLESALNLVQAFEPDEAHLVLPADTSAADGQAIVAAIASAKLPTRLIVSFTDIRVPTGVPIGLALAHRIPVSFLGCGRGVGRLRPVESELLGEMVLP